MSERSREEVKKAPKLPKPSLDIHSITWPQIERLLRPSHGLCVAGRTLPCKIEIKSMVQLSYLLKNFLNICYGFIFY